MIMIMIMIIIMIMIMILLVLIFIMIVIECSENFMRMQFFFALPRSFRKDKLENISRKRKMKNEISI